MSIHKECKLAFERSMNEAVLSAEQQLIKLACNGESKAINHLISQYQSKIFLQIRAQVSDYAIAYDLLQEVNIKIFRYLPYFKQQSTFTTWVYRIIQNTIKNYFRSRKTERDFGYYLEIQSSDESDSPESQMIGIEFGQELDKIFTAMPQELRHSFHLYAIYGFSYEDIAKYQDCPVGTVRSRIHRARSILKDTIYPQNQLI